MKFKNPLLVVKDMAASKAFYKEILNLRVVLDFGANVTLTGGVCLQTEESWKGFIRSEAVSYGGQDAELYFEEDDFDAFAERLKATDRVKYVHPVFEHRWGQRVVRFFDPDGHIVEGERKHERGVRAFCRCGYDGGGNRRAYGRARLLRPRP